MHDFSVSFGEANLRTIKRSFAPVTRYPLTFCICEFHRDDPIEIAIDACSSHFDKSETKNIGERIHTIVNQIFDEPDKKVSDIELVTPAEKRQLLDIGTAPIPEQHQSNQVGETVLHKIQHWVQTTPDAIAVKTAHQSFSYAQLQQLMDKNISQLMHQGIGKGDRIALALERSPETLVLLLAISRLGGVYVPMDPHSSTEHLKSLITECQANLVVHQLDTDAFDDLDIQSASWQQWQVKLDTQDEENAKLTPLPLPKASDPVYILFTSGSSGKPKGVLMSHSALASRIRWLAQKLAYSTTDVALQSIALTFDPAQIEIYLPLTSGACCALVPAGQLAPEQILAEVNNLGATSMIFVPTVLRLFLNALPNNQKTPLRLVICGGEQLEQQLAKRCTDKLAVRLFNLYGPTEACIFASWHEYQGLPPCKVIDNQTSQSITHQNPAVPIGAPVGDTQLLVLDEHDRLLPYGATGQLCIGGKGLANGYLDAEQTVARFIRSQNNQTCLYKTGDAVYWNPDQQLVFAGRIDRQLKLRGVRIEPDTIEPVLCSLNMVRLACVDIRQEQLCAWLELNTADGTTDSETAARQAEFAKQINQQLWNKLPAHYIPQRLFVVTQIPLLSSGKPDLKQLDTELSVELKDHSSKSAISENIIVEKSSGQNHDREIHTWLLQAWQEILFKENNAKNEQKAVPGIDASFLQLGGNSLTALSVLSRIDKHFGIKLTLSCFLQNDSIRKLTAVIKEQQCSVCINLSKHQLGKRIYIAASGHGDALRFQRLADALSPHAHVVMLQPPHDASIKQLASPKDIAQLYVDKIHDENYTGSFCLAGFSVGGVIALEAARLCQQQHLAIEDVVLLDTTYPNWFIRHTPLWKIILKWVEHANKQQLKNNQTNASQITPNHLFSDIGLWTQVSALQNYSMAKLDLPATLVTSTGYQLWYRWLFKPWSKVFSANFREHKLKGTHSSIFDTEKVTALRDMFFARLSEKS